MGRAIDIYRHVVAAREETLPRDDKRIEVSRYNLADHLEEVGRYAEAARQFRVLEQTRTRTLGADHEKTVNVRWCASECERKAAGNPAPAAGNFERRSEIRTVNDRALRLVKEGDFAQAAELFKWLGEVHVESFDAEDPAALTEAHNLAHSLSMYGSKDKAIEIYRYVLAGREEILPADAEDTRITRGNLAILFKNARRFTEAAEQYGKVVATERRVLGEKDPKTLSDVHSWAFALAHAGRVDEAIEIYRRLVAAWEELVSPEDERILAARYNLGDHLEEVGAFAEAAQQFRALEQARARAQGEDHEKTRQARSRAIECERQAAAGTPRPEDTPRPADASELAERLVKRNAEAVEHMRDGWLYEAMAGLFEAATEARELDGDDHPLAVSLRANLAFCLGEAGYRDEAAQAFGRIAASLERSLGARHPATQSAHLNRARWAGDVEELRSIADARVRTLGGQDPASLVAGDHLAVALHGARRDEEAARVLRDLIKLR